MDESRSFVEENQRDVGFERVINLPGVYCELYELKYKVMRFRIMLIVIVHKFCREKRNPSPYLRPSFPC